MGISVVRFNTKDRPEFIKELRKRINTYFKENNISRYGNWNMKVKTAFMLCLYFTPLVLMLTGVVSSVWMVMLMWVLMGLGMSGIGLSIMHDAIHGAYSKNKNVNLVLGYVIHFIGGYHANWRIQHNVLHHSFTNVDGLDEDIDTGVLMRFSPDQERKKGHKFQAFYAPFFYGIMTMYWSTTKDFGQLLRYKKKDLLVSQGVSFKKALAEVTFHKVWYFALTLALPIILVDLPWWQTVLGFLLMHFICGSIISYIFQLAHVIEETKFYKAEEDGSVENNWAVHQMKTTANFAQGARMFSWFIGGLNYQVEHHLFPNICHVHYRKIAHIVKATAEEFKVPYNEHKTFWGALKSHFSMLNNLGTGKYDKLQAATA